VSPYTVAVHPGTELRSRARLFGALAEAFPVRFEAREAVGRSDNAVIAFGVDRERLPPGPQRWYVVAGGPGRPLPRSAVRFGASPLLDARLRERTLEERHAGDGDVAPRRGDAVLASIEGRPVWLKDEDAARTIHTVAYAPIELAEGEYLRDRLDPGRFLELLPLVHWLREVCAPSAWDPPAARAAFIVDDANLHWPTYGYLNYRELVAHGRKHGYHLSVAMVPVDGWYAHRPTVRLFHESTDVLSLSVHGNDHRRNELGRPVTADEGRRLLGQASRRVAAFTRRTGLRVSPVIVPPYEAYSSACMEATVDVGFEAATLNRPAPWLPHGPRLSPYFTSDSDHVLSGWHPLEVTRAGLPLMIRRQFHELDEIVLRAFLGQPVILNGHVGDFANGLDPLALAAAAVNSLPSVQWAPLEDIAAASFESRRASDTLEIRPFARRIAVRVAPDVAAIRLHPPPRGDELVAAADAVVAGDGVRLPHGDDGVIELPTGRASGAIVEIRWRPRDDLAAPAPSRRIAPTPVLRRVLAEGKDRLEPLATRRLRGILHDRPRPSDAVVIGLPIA
jgi:hypothetical protein